MIVDVTFKNSKGTTYKAHGQLIKQDKRGITLRHSTGNRPPFLMNYQDEIVELKECRSIRGLSRRVLDDIKS